MTKEVCSFCNDNKFIWNVLCGIDIINVVVLIMRSYVKSKNE